ncbi:YqaI family protein [Solibacillus cecembensis]|uniref:YqaI family protein n=1 Tax=Solibacillus cecembensis TaxID=459347 RepID=UPI003CFE35D0
MDIENPIIADEYEEIFLDIYGTEIVPGEEYIEAGFGCAIHKENAIRYLLEDDSHKLKTR